MTRSAGAVDGTRGASSLVRRLPEVISERAGRHMRFAGAPGNSKVRTVAFRVDELPERRLDALLALGSAMSNQPDAQDTTTGPANRTD